MYDNKVLDHSYLYWLWKNIAILYENQIEKKLETEFRYSVRLNKLNYKAAHIEWFLNRDRRMNYI